ncbi:hypothetical protein GCM10022251_53860 [Phytohabitans flavus]|uniref:Uncharacterized protein n=1 Tax=Phytohabitans flavus TaxID=1076124 RepID=A0A6F8XM09_9ACTN|nr:hypothetical protein [Phytohabitans flavus]BCB74852.1 hypothetical protein Pflav_012620 [Phytohabitans flavus]
MTDLLTPVDPDNHASASHRHMTEHLTGPLQTGAVESRIAISTTGAVELTTVTREPLLVLAPARALDGVAWSVTADLPDGTDLVLDFAPGTEAGAYLPLYRPPTDPDTGTAAPFTIRLRLVAVHGAERVAVPAAQLAEHLAVRLVEGITGRVLYLLGAEKQRIRRQARELARIRTIDGAHGDALDRIGAELGVPRFFDTIRFRDPAPDERASVFGRFAFGERRFGPGRSGEITAEGRREPDEEYRHRLDIYRPWLYPTRRQVEAMLNGPGRPSDPNRGLLAAIGVTARALVTDTARPAAAAVHLVGVEALRNPIPPIRPIPDGPIRPVPPRPLADRTGRTGFFEYARQTTLIWPGDDAEADRVHAARYLPTAAAEQVETLRRRLRAGFGFPARGAVGPMLALALDRVGRCRRALGESAPWPLPRCQDPAGGSRYELGLGADLATPGKAELARMERRLRDGDLKLPAEPTDLEPDPAETAALLASATPRPPDEDPDGAWLLQACGLETVHRVRDDLLYVSHIPTFGLTISGPSTTTLGGSVALQARYHAAGEPGSHILLVRGLRDAAQEWAARGRDPWQVLEPPAAQAAWDAAVPTPEAAKRALEPVGLPMVTAPADVAERLRRVPPELMATLRLPTLVARQITTGSDAAIAALRDLLNVLSSQGLSSALLLVLAEDHVAVVVGGVALPLAGLNLAERAATHFRWYAVRIWPTNGATPGHPEITYLGARTEFTPARWGLYAIVALGQIRSQTGTEPYEFTVDLPDGTILNLLQYEYLMNVLAHLHPMGTRVNTWSIRQRHVDLDGDGTAEPVPSNISRTYRQFRRPRFRGATATAPGDTS